MLELARERRLTGPTLHMLFHAEMCLLLLQAASGHMPADGSANELCVTAGVLSSVAGSPHAAHKLLSAYSGRLRSAQQRLLKPQNAGGW